MNIFTDDKIKDQEAGQLVVRKKGNGITYGKSLKLKAKDENITQK